MTTSNTIIFVCLFVSALVCGLWWRYEQMANATRFQIINNRSLTMRFDCKTGTAWVLGTNDGWEWSPVSENLWRQYEMKKKAL